MTDEVLSHILPGLENIKVSRTQYVNGHLLPKFSVGWSLVSFRVRSHSDFWGFGNFCT